MNFEELKRQMLMCRECESKFGFTPSPIFHGRPHSTIVQIGQAPSHSVHLTGKPFNDPSGDRLKYKWYGITDDIFYDENRFYMASMAHCYPGKNPKGGDNPPPSVCSKKWLTKELDMVHNELYIVIGARAAKFLFPDDRFEDLVFKDNALRGKPTLVLPHPSPLNVRWFKNHPQFEEERIPEIRRTIWRTLGLKDVEP